VAFGNGSLYALRDGQLFSEMGRQISEKTKAGSLAATGLLSVDSDQKQVKLISNERGANSDLFLYSPQCFVLDLKQSERNIGAADDVTLSRSLFSGAWFRWAWRLGTPTSSSIFYQGSEYYISQNIQFSSLTATPTDLMRSRYHAVSGLWIREPLGSANLYSDGSLPIRNVVNFTPIHKGQFDMEKAWVSFKIFRLLSGSDVPYVTDWQAAVDLIFGLSNNYLTLDADILKLTSSVEFSNIKVTQAICPISGNYSPALEIKITVDELFKAIGFSSIILDYFEPFDTEGQRTTSKDF